MRVTIKGLTDSTITFNTLGIILRGNSAKSELYPNSIAKNIDINTDEQMRELVCLKNARYVEFFDESNVQAKHLATNNIVKIQPIQPIQKVADLPQPPKENIVEEVLEDPEDLEDGPVRQPQKDEEETLTISSKSNKSNKPTKKKIGRPKKIKDDKKSKKDVAPLESDKSDKSEKPEKPDKTDNKTISVKKIKKAKNYILPPETNNEDSKIVVMTPGGPVSGYAANNMAGEIPESEATRASIEALKQLEEEESQPDSLIDESKLNESEKMGGTVVIATGEGTMKKVPMKNSLLPEAAAIKNRGVKFIDPTGDDSLAEKPKDPKNDVKNAFIDSQDDEDQDNNLIEC